MFSLNNCSASSIARVGGIEPPARVYELGLRSRGDPWRRYSASPMGLGVPLRVAFDVGPLHGHRTGVGHAVGAMFQALEGADAADDMPAVTLIPYLTSARARLADDTRRLPIPAALAHRLWSRLPGPCFDRWLGDVDVVHGTNYVVPPSRLPRVVSVYDCWFLEHPELAQPAVARAGAVLRRAVDSGAHVHTSSDATNERVRRILSTDRVTTVHLAPLPLQPTPPDPPIAGLPPGRFVVAIGTEERRKNLPRLVDAYDRAVGDGLDAHLVIAGTPGDDSVQTTTAIERARPAAQRRIVRLGRIGDTTKWWLLHHATALAYPSLDEGFGFPILEAQGVGTAVVGGDAGSIPEIGGDGVELVDPHDVDSIADGLLHVVGDEAHRQHRIELGATNVRRFSWTSTAQQLTAIYDRLARNR